MRIGIRPVARPDGIGLAVSGEMDLDNAPELRRALLAAVREHDVVVLDLSGVTFLDSQGLGVLVRAANEARERGSALRIERASDRVRQLLELTRLTSVLPIGP